MHETSAYQYEVVYSKYIVVCTYTLFCRVGDGTVPLAIVVYIDSSFVKHKIPVKPFYGAKQIFSPFPTFHFPKCF